MIRKEYSILHNWVRNKLGKEGYWAKDLWCDHLGYTTDNLGYPD